MEYPNLIECVLKCPILANAIEEMTLDSGMLNLVHPDWESKLNKYPVHQRHLNKEVAFSKGHVCNNDKAYIKHIAVPRNSYKVIVLASLACTRKKPQEPESPPGDLYFIARECPPLTCIAEAMKESPSHKLHDGANLFMEYCNPILCNICLTEHTKQHVPYDIHQNWCVLKTRKFDGNELTHDFKKSLEPVLERLGSFLAIVQLNIYSRTTFGEDKFKIGGKIKNLLVFQESAIQPRVTMKFSKELTVLPSIEFPNGEDANDEDTSNKL